MNRKKITLLLTGLVVASSMFMGCSSSDNKSNNKAETNKQVATQDEFFRRATDRTVREYDDEMGDYPNVAYADDITGEENIDNRSSMRSIDGHGYNSGMTNNMSTTSESHVSDDSSYGMDTTSDNNMTNDNYSMNTTNDNSHSSMNTTSGYSMTTDSNNNEMSNSSESSNTRRMKTSGYSVNSSDEIMSEDMVNSFTGNTTGINGYTSSSEMENTTDHNTMNHNGTNIDRTKNGNRASSIDSTNSMNNTTSSTSTENITNNSSNTKSITSTDNTNIDSNNASGKISYTDTNNNTNNIEMQEENNSNENINSSNSQSNITGDNADGMLNIYDENNENVTSNQEISEDSSYNTMQARSGAEVKIVGEFTPVGTIGTSHATGTGSSAKTEGVIALSFKLSQDAIDAMGLDSVIQDAYAEAIDDSNQSFQGSSTSKREALISKLSTAFGKSGTLTMMFKDPEGKLVNVPFTASAMFPSSDVNYKKHVIDLGQMRSGNGRRAARNVRSNSSDVVMRMLIMNESVTGDKSKELDTNTLYTFEGFSGTDANKDNIKVTDSDGYITGFDVPVTTTGKESSKLSVKGKGSTEALYTSTDWSNNEGSAVTGSVEYTTKLDTNKEFINVNKTMYDLKAIENVKSEGNNIKFPNIKFNDRDETIVKIEAEDNRGKIYPCTLVPEEEGDEAYLQINGLEPETRYVFIKLHVVSNIGGYEERDTITIAETSGTVVDGKKVFPNRQDISTTTFAEPKVNLAVTSNPDEIITLPGGMKLPAVKNDSTALRYVFKVDNSQDNIEDLRVIGLGTGEEANIQKFVDRKYKINYYIVTLRGLKPDTEYGQLTVELDYKDLSGTVRTGRQSISNINANTNGKPKNDNRTEKDALTGTDAANVLLETNTKSKYARSAQIPVYIDDIHRTFTGMNYTSSDNPNVKVEYRNGYLFVTGLKPESNTSITLDFLSKDSNGGEKKLTKYIRITTPAAPRVDVIADTATVKGNDVEIKFDYDKMPSSPIQKVEIKDENDKVLDTTWNPTTSTITIKGLEAKKDYSNLIATFTLQNTLTVDYPITPFRTEEEIVKPTGKVANFVQRVYTIALGREPEVEGWNFWINKLEKKEISATEFIAENLMTQPEFVDRELTKANFVTTMYSLIVNRAPEAEGQAYWERKYDEYKSSVKSIAELRIKIAREMMDQDEFKELITSINLKY